VISKRGRSRLRRFLFMATISLVMNNSEFQAMHAQNVHVKKMKKMKSIAANLILVGMARSGPMSRKKHCHSSKQLKHVIPFRCT
jgi:transposase